LLATLPARIISSLGRTLVLEMHIARLEGRLEGETPEMRFQSFVQMISQTDGALEILRRYPVLARQLVCTIENWTAFSIELVERLCKDWVQLKSYFGVPQPGALISLRSGLGDSHNSGRTVTIVEFESGFRLLYKPRSVSIDVHFQILLQWLNRHGMHPAFRTISLFDQQNYGWAEYVHTAPCKSVVEVKRFYQRQGSYLALLYALNATDFHFGNIIAAGEHPILVDLESLFQSRIPSSAEVPQIDALASEIMAESVLSIGLLPARIWGNDEAKGVDLSGLGASTNQQLPFKTPYWQAAGTDQMHLMRRHVQIYGSQHRPTILGRDVILLDYVDAIIEGFKSAYTILMKCRTELDTRNGLLAHFAKDESRAILRPTRFYAELLHESYHPDFLSNALLRDRHFDLLWVAAARNSELEKVIKAERQDMYQGDIPRFTTQPGSRHIWTSNNERIANFFELPGLERVQKRLQKLNNADLQQQVWFIHSSLAAYALNTTQEARWTTSERQLNMPADEGQFIEMAQIVGERLSTAVIRGAQNTTWISLTSHRWRDWSLSPCGLDLYHGLPGIILFFAYLGCITQEEKYITLAKTTLLTMEEQIERSRGRLTQIGGFNGWGGVIYVLTHLGVLWQQIELLEQAEELTIFLTSLIPADKMYDIVAGAAGCLASLYVLFRQTASPSVLRVAVQCGEHLCTKAQMLRQGIGWSSISDRPLSGFAHGNAGIAWALIKLASLTGDERFQHAAMAALAYERSLFAAEVGNWRDLRELPERGESGNKDSFSTAWCHGAPGIGLARFDFVNYVQDGVEKELLLEEANIAVQTTITNGFGHNHSLCHGDLGNLELLLQASEALDDSQLKRRAYCIGKSILDNLHKGNWAPGIPLGVEIPGLMTGMAGIGYGLLRLAAPERVPAVLLLAPPASGGWFGSTTPT
jgi:type 2 lantibiotic biosynthesis protein LanM